MPIKVTPMKYDAGSCFTDTDNARLEHEGRVVRVQTSMKSRNHSDTMDYTDFRMTEVTEALVYRGRTWKGVHGFDKEETECPVEHRFHWIDCTNLFTWRGSDHRLPTADPQWQLLLVPGLIEDYAAWEEIQNQQQAAAAKREQEAKALQAHLEAAAIRNRPAVGKKMRVAKGRKVPVGTIGVVSYLSGSGSALLKNENEWQDRASGADGANAEPEKSVVFSLLDELGASSLVRREKIKEASTSLKRAAGG